MLFAGRGNATIHFSFAEGLATPVRIVEPRQEKLTHPVLAACLLIAALIVDIGLTAHGVKTEYDGFHRKVFADASIVNVTKSEWRGDVATGYVIVVKFDDADGIAQSAMMDFAVTKAKGAPAWVPGDLVFDLERGKRPEKIKIGFDPLNPKRVWGARENWNRENAIHYIFAMLHVFQLCIGLTFAFAILDNGKHNPEQQRRLQHNVEILPFAVEAAFLLLVGFAFWMRGF